MTSGEPLQPLTSRLNPFAFPSDTDFRFWLLIFSVFGSSFFIYTNILTRWVLPKHFFGVQGALSANCHALVANELTSCIQHNRDILLPWIAGTTFFLLGVAVIIHWTRPYRIMRQSSLVLFNNPDIEDVAAYVEDLFREVALSRFPILVWNPLNPVRSAQAFGRFGRHYVALSGGLVAQFYTDRAAFRAVILHELAHLKNADVDKTYFTVAIWQAFVITVLVPFAVSRFNESASETVDLSWRVVALSVFVYLTRSAVLRTREFYADVRASVWDGPTGALRSVLAQMPQPRREGWRALFRVHPQPLERRRVIEDTYPLFQMKFWDALGAGMAAGIVCPYIRDLLNYMGGYTVESSRSFWLGPGILVPLAACAVGIQVWRATFAEMMRGNLLPSTFRGGLGLASGLFFGELLSLTPNNAGGQVVVITWDAVLLITVAAFMPWIAAGASIWLEVGITLGSPRAIYRFGLIVASLLLGTWYAVVSVSAQMSTRALNWGIVAIFLFPLSDPLFLVVSTGLWAFPLSAWFWRARFSRSQSGWAFLDQSPHVRTFAQQAPLNFDVALKIGTLGGFIGSLVAVTALTAQRMGPLVTRIRHWDPYPIAWIAVVVVIEAAASEIVRRRVRRLPAVHGLFAASIAGWLVILAILGVKFTYKETVTAEYVMERGCWIVNSGAMASLLVMFGWQFFKRSYDWLVLGTDSEGATDRFLVDLLRASHARGLSSYFGTNLGWLEGQLRVAIETIQDRKVRRKLALVCTTLLILFLGGLLGRSYKETDLASRLVAGKLYLDEGDWDSAIFEYRRALTRQPNNAAAYAGLGKALAQKGQLDQAIAEFRNALVLKNNDADTHFNLGLALGRQAKVEEAVAEFRETIRLNPKYAGPRNDLGIGLRIQGKYEEAIAEFREAIQLDSSYAEPHYNLGKALRDRGEYEQAIAEFREAIRLSPQYAEAHNNLGGTLRIQGKYGEAIAEFREAVRLRPKDGRARSNLINALHGRGRHEEAIAELQKVHAFQSSESAEITADLGYFLALPGRLDEVIASIEKSLQAKPSEPYTVDTLVFALDAQGLSWFRKAAYAGDAHGMSGLGFLYENGRGGLAKDDVQAVSWYCKAADAGSARGMANLGRMYAIGRGGLPQDDVQAVSWLRKAADAGNARGMANLGRMYAYGRGGLPQDDVQAVSWFRKAADAGDARGVAGLGFLYESGRGGLPKDDAKALSCFRKAVDAGDALGMANLGFLYESGRGGLPTDHEQAVKWYRRAADAGNGLGMANLAGMYFYGKGGLPTDDAEALSWYRKAADAGEPRAMFKLGNMYESGLGGLPKDDSQALSWYRKAAGMGEREADKALKHFGR